jgi:hypothetical protein
MVAPLSAPGAIAARFHWVKSLLEAVALDIAHQLVGASSTRDAEGLGSQRVHEWRYSASIALGTQDDALKDLGCTQLRA